MSVTRVNFHPTFGVPSLVNERITEFTDKADFIEAVAASSYIPVLDRRPFHYFRNGYYLDGGITDNIPILDHDTITIEPFQWSSYRNTFSRRIGFAHLRTCKKWQKKLFEKGYQDGQKHKEYFSKLTPLAVPIKPLYTDFEN